MRLLQSLVENRRKLVDQRTAISNRLTDMLGEIHDWFAGCGSSPYCESPFRELEKRIAELAQQQEDWPIFDSLPEADKRSHLA